MTNDVAGRKSRAVRRLLGSDSPGDLAAVVGLFAVFLVLDRLTKQLASLSEFSLRQPVLSVSAFQQRPLLVGGLLVCGAIGLHVGWQRVMTSWIVLDHGKELRLLTAPLIVYLAWQSSLCSYNFVLGQTHLIDRVIVLLAVLALARPAFLLPFIVQTRLIVGQFDFPFGTRATSNEQYQRTPHPRSSGAQRRPRAPYGYRQGQHLGNRPSSQRGHQQSLLLTR